VNSDVGRCVYYWAARDNGEGKGYRFAIPTWKHDGGYWGARIILSSNPQWDWLNISGKVDFLFLFFLS